MAEAAQYHIERLVDDLNDLAERKIFSDLEIKTALKKITAYEYRLQRRTLKKEDFKVYLEFLSDFYECFVLRKMRLNIHTKNASSDVFLMQKIHQVFGRFTGRFSADPAVWLQHVEFCVAHDNSKVLSSVLSRALQLHPLEVAFWRLAALWEFESNANMPGARIFMQRALRLMPEKRELWLEYFNLEFLYWKKLSERKRILGVDVPENASPAICNTQLLVPELEGEEEGVSHENLSSLEASVVADAKKHFLDNSAILLVIFEEAIERHKDLTFAASFVRLLLASENSLYPKFVCNEIVAAIRRNFHADSSLPFALHIVDFETKGQGFGNFVTLLDEFVAAPSFSSKELPFETADFMLQFVEQTKAKFADQIAYKDLHAFYVGICEQNAIFSSIQTVLKLASIFEEYGDTLQALNFVNEALKHISHCEDLWEKRLLLGLACAKDISSPTELKALSALVEVALEDVCVAQTLKKHQTISSSPSFDKDATCFAGDAIKLIYLKVLDQCLTAAKTPVTIESQAAKKAAFNAQTHKLKKCIDAACKKFLQAQNSPAVLAWFCDWDEKHRGAESVRNELLPSMQRIWLKKTEFLRIWTEWERNTAQPNIELICKLWDEVLADDEAARDANLWLEYVECLVLDFKEYLRASQVYTRAVRSLSNQNNLSFFIQSFNNIKNYK